MNIFRMVVISLMSLSVLATGVAMGWRADRPAERERAGKLFTQGNFKDAYEIYRALALDATTDPALVGHDLDQGVKCLVQLGRVDEADAFREAVIVVHKTNWRLLEAAAESYLNDKHIGFIIAGKFQRGPHRGGGKYVGSDERDRSRALQLMVQGLDLAKSDPDRGAVGPIFLTFARALMGDRDTTESWRLQSLTPLDRLADYDDNPYAHGNSEAGAPVEPDGTPVYYRVPAIVGNGQERRRALAVGARPGRGSRPGLAQHDSNGAGRFSSEPVRTSRRWRIHRSSARSADGQPEASGPYAVDTLAEDETIARLATGIKRFKMPDEFNPIKIYQTIAADPKTGKGEEAL